MGPVHFVRCVGWCSEHAKCICGSGVNINANVDENMKAELLSQRPACLAGSTMHVAGSTPHSHPQPQLQCAAHPPDQLQSTLSRAVAIAVSTCSSTAPPAASGVLGPGPELGLGQARRCTSKRPLSVPSEEDMDESSEADEEAGDGAGEGMGSDVQTHEDRGAPGSRLDNGAPNSPTGFHQCLSSGDIPLDNVSVRGRWFGSARSGGGGVADTSSVIGALWRGEGAAAAAGLGGPLGSTRQNNGKGHKAMRLAEQHDGAHRGLGALLETGNSDRGSAVLSSSSTAAAAASFPTTRRGNAGQEGEGTALAAFS